ncbi:transcriptional regulator with XRE-family HTH domain [Desulfohalotomaculum tongense]|uniref:helix-turn-helix domain-containing protein n=1 Tax=Desulforadius tongensis TaxID=1216062 RepID=UPI001957FF2D|nr:transcriptional regulator with XRE-family HTH domain [Desulforadius tongensis]
MQNEFGSRLRQLREKRKLTQSDLAKLCGLGESTISFYESGKREPSYKTLLCLAEKLNTTPNYLLKGDDEQGDNLLWWEKDSPPSEIELEHFIREQPNLRIFGDPLDGEVKDDVMLALRTAWEVLKGRSASKQPKGKK